MGRSGQILDAQANKRAGIWMKQENSKAEKERHCDFYMDAVQRVTVLAAEPIGTINPNLHGHFAEHLGELVTRIKGVCYNNLIKSAVVYSINE